MDFIDSIFSARSAFNFAEIECEVGIDGNRFRFGSEIGSYYINPKHHKEDLEYIRQDIKRHEDSIAHKLPKNCDYYIPYGRLIKLNTACDLVNKLYENFPTLKCVYQNGFLHASFFNLKIEIGEESVYLYGGRDGLTYIKGFDFSENTIDEIVTDIGMRVNENSPKIICDVNHIKIETHLMSQWEKDSLLEYINDYIKDME